MTVRTALTLVLHGVAVETDGLTVAARRVDGTASGRPAFALSMRHPSPGRSLESESTRPPLPYNHGDGGGSAAIQAGRPGSSAGVPSCRIPATCAGGTVLSRWSSCKGVLQPMTNRLASLLVRMPATRMGRVLLKRSLPSDARPLSMHKPFPMKGLWQRWGKQWQVDFQSAAGTQRASTQGNGK